MTNILEAGSLLTEIQQQVPSLPATIFVNSPLFIGVVREGISGQTLKQIVDLVALKSVFERLFETSPSNLSRYYTKKKLSGLQTEAVLDLCRLFLGAVSALGDLEKARGWMQSRLIVLGDESPESFCDTFEGRKLVAEQLRKIGSGEFV